MMDRMMDMNMVTGRVTVMDMGVSVGVGLVAMISSGLFVYNVLRPTG